MISKARPKKLASIVPEHLEGIFIGTSGYTPLLMLHTLDTVSNLVTFFDMRDLYLPLKAFRIRNIFFNVNGERRQIVF